MPNRHPLIESLRVRVCSELPTAHVGPIEQEPEMCSFSVALANAFVLEVCCDSTVAQPLYAVLRVHGGPLRTMAFENYYDQEIGGGRSSLTSVEVVDMLRRYSDVPTPGPVHGHHAGRAGAPGEGASSCRIAGTRCALHSAVRRQDR